MPAPSPARLCPLAVVAVGGNALITDPRKQRVEDQREAACHMADRIADMIAEGWQVVVTHGNGPQVGFELIRSQAASHVVPPVPMDVCGAFTQGAIGYLLQQGLRNALRRRGLARTVATVVTQVRVDADDPAFQRPTKPVGPFYDQAEAERHRAEQGWTVVEDAGRGYRRVVPSPDPREIVELEAIADLVARDAVVIATGGGGIPVVERSDGSLEGMAAVIDKDLASSLLARELGADLLLISTGVDRVALDFGKPTQRELPRLTASEARRYLAEGHFPAGSMGPKIEAIVRFLEASGKAALITSPASLVAALRQEAGTWIVKDGDPATNPDLTAPIKI